MTIWSPELVEDGPVYLAITRALESDIARGRLRSGDRLPTHRDLAAELGVNVGTVTRAYGEARRRGLIEGEVGRGTWVRERERSVLSRAEPEREDGPIDLSINVPTAMPGPDLASALEALAAEDRAAPGLLDARTAYHDPAGDPDLRRAGAHWLARLGLDVSADQLVVCAGAQHAILVALGAVAAPGDLVLGEALTYPGFLASSRTLGLRVQGVAIDEDGVVPEALESICRESRPRALYCMPNLQNPTCAQLPRERREAIADIARRHDLMIVQDEIHAGLVDDDPTSLARLAPERVLTIASLSKTLSPGVRTAFLAAPDELIPRLVEGVWGSVWMAAPLGGLVAQRWLEDDTIERVLTARREELTIRHALAAKALRDLPFATRESAYHLWVPLPEGWDGPSASAALGREGVKASPADEFRIEGMPSVAAIRLSLSATRSRARLEAGLEIVARVLGARPLRSALV